MRELSVIEAQVVGAAGRGVTPAVTNLSNSNVEGFGNAQAFGIGGGLSTASLGTGFAVKSGSASLAANGWMKNTGIGAVIALIGFVGMGVGLGINYGIEKHNAQ